MLSITLDTNVVVEHRYEEALTRIKQLACGREVDMAVTTRVEADKRRDTDEARKREHLDKLDEFPKIGTVARWDMSTWDSGDVWG